jgi:hypothetical protein
MCELLEELDFCFKFSSRALEGLGKVFSLQIE